MVNINLTRSLTSVMTTPKTTVRVSVTRGPSQTAEEGSDSVPGQQSADNVSSKRFDEVPRPFSRQQLINYE